jgi:hypothetical protein
MLPPQVLFVEIQRQAIKGGRIPHGVHDVRVRDELKEEDAANKLGQEPGEEWCVGHLNHDDRQHQCGRGDEDVEGNARGVAYPACRVVREWGYMFDERRQRLDY